MIPLFGHDWARHLQLRVCVFVHKARSSFMETGCNKLQAQTDAYYSTRHTLER